MCQLICRLIPIIALLGLAGGLAYYFLSRNHDISLPDIDIDWPTLDEWHREAPWNASSPEEAQRWENNGQGLSLTLLNALDSSWYGYFDAAVADWEAGSNGTDPLTLTSQLISAESECVAEPGFQKVCNGDYGDTGWNGLNTILVYGGLMIDSSAAQMNDYYLQHGSDALKQYTMCHELGHGFGLPHTDESFWNRDLGNCMDYTMNPGSNMHPDSGNFEFLNSLYGNSGATAAAIGDNGVESAADATTGQQSSSGTNRKLFNYNCRQKSRMPYWIQRAWKSVKIEFNDINSETANEDQGWRLLHSLGNQRSHSLDIGQGYSIIVHLSLAKGYEDRLRRT